MKKIIILLACLAFVSIVAAQDTPFVVELNMLDRFVASSLLPKKASFAEWRLINNLKDELAPTQKELKTLEMKATSNGDIVAKWDAVPKKKIEFSKITKRMIVEALKKLDSNSELLAEQIPLYKIFVVRDQ